MIVGSYSLTANKKNRWYDKKTTEGCDKKSKANE